MGYIFRPRSSSASVPGWDADELEPSVGESGVEDEARMAEGSCILQTQNVIPSLRRDDTELTKCRGYPGDIARPS
jgi:hypothetical protein